MARLANSEVMGMVSADVAIFAPDESQQEAVRLLVDIGSTLIWIHREVLEALGYRPRDERSFRPIDGREEPLRRHVGDAVIECEGLRGSVGVVFALPGDGQVLGVTALEHLGLAVDPSTGALVKEDVFLAVAVA